MLLQAVLCVSCWLRLAAHIVVKNASAVKRLKFRAAAAAYYWANWPERDLFIAQATTC